MSEKKGAMQGFMDWMAQRISPAMERLGGNAWISGMQKAVITTLPMVLVGSVITVYQTADKAPDWTRQSGAILCKA